MRIKIQQEVLKNALQKMSRIVHSKAIVPAHKNIELDIHDNILHMYVCSGESTLGLQLHDITIEENRGTSKTVVGYKPLFDLITRLPECNLDITFTDINITVGKSSGLKSAYKLVAFPIKEFNDLLMQRLPEESPTAGLPADIFIQEVNRASSFIAGPSMINLSFQNVLLRFTGNSLHIIGSDRAQVYRYILPIAQQITGDYLLSSKIIASMVQAFKNESIINIKVSNSMVEFYSENNYFIASLVQHVYPDISKVLDMAPKVTFNAPKDDLSNCLSRISIVSEEGVDVNKVNVDINKDFMTLSGGASDNTGEEEVPLAEYQGVPLRMMFNPNKLLNGLVACDDSVYFGMTSNSGPITVRSNPCSNDLFMMMPYINK